MKKILGLLALVALSTSAFQSQNLTGTWQGTLQGGPANLRLVIKISLDDDKLKSVFYSIDQKSPPIPASATTRDGSNLKITIAVLGGGYEGKIAADGNSIAGTWTQGGRPSQLNLVRATPETAWAIPDPPPPPVRMAANADPAFDVATIKPSDPDRLGKLFTVRGAEVITINTTVNDLTAMAYSLHPKQLVGAPSWLDSEKYDVTGKPDVPGQPSSAQLKILIQKLLADRFQFKFHREKRELSVYALTVGKSGPKFSKSERPPESLPGLFFTGPGTSFNVTNATIAEVANVLQGAVLDRPVVDQTGLTGKYDFILEWTREPG